MILICSIFLAFFFAFITVYIIAKIFSVPPQNKSEINDLTGAEFNCVISDIEFKKKGFMETPIEKDK